jgi:hypothetical protein
VQKSEGINPHTSLSGQVMTNPACPPASVDPLTVWIRTAGDLSTCVSYQRCDTAVIRPAVKSLESRLTDIDPMWTGHIHRSILTCQLQSKIRICPRVFTSILWFSLNRTRAACTNNACAVCVRVEFDRTPWHPMECTIRTDLGCSLITVLHAAK